MGKVEQPLPQPYPQILELVRDNSSSSGGGGGGGGGTQICIIQAEPNNTRQDTIDSSTTMRNLYRRRVLPRAARLLDESYWDDF